MAIPTRGEPCGLPFEVSAEHPVEVVTSESTCCCCVDCCDWTVARVGRGGGGWANRLMGWGAVAEVGSADSVVEREGTEK